MGTIASIPRVEDESVTSKREDGDLHRQTQRPLISIVVPAYNEDSLAERHLLLLCTYMNSLEDEYRWEMVIVNDGSTDQTGQLADAFAKDKDNVHVLHHLTNVGVGEAFKSAFHVCQGDYVVTLDLDLSYSPDHIRRLVEKVRTTQAKVVVASPYMKGGRVSNVPWLRRILSRYANRFLASTAKANLSTLTSMVRAYDGKFLRSLNLRSTGMEINPEVIYKARLMHVPVEEVAAHLDWSQQKAEGIKRRSSLKLLRHTFAVIVSGFLFRPVMFFIVPGLALLLFALYVNTWILVHFLDQYQNASQHTWFFSRASAAVGAAYAQSPHTFIVGLLSSMLAIQLLSLGILALQSKSYFEEIFHLGANIYRVAREKETVQSK